MKTISWKQAFDIATSYNDFDKVTLIVFIDDCCVDCNGFVDNLPQLENDQYQVFIVKDGDAMPFKPVNYPVGYVYIPNSKPFTVFYENVPIDSVMKNAQEQVQTMLAQT